jgi:holo-[acyl-carrier protein] synthase
MPITGIGLDLVQVARLRDLLERRGERALQRLFTEGERAYCERRPMRRYESYAGRFAVKEATMKLLGTGWARGVRWVDIEVVRRPGQAPELVLHGRSAELAAARGIARIHVTITHDAGIAAAVAVGEGSAAG